MRLISLNIWGGRRFNDLAKFLEKEKERTNVFCFQEVLYYKLGEPTRDSVELKLMLQPDVSPQIPDLYPRLQSLLPDFNGFLSEPYTPGMERLATFVKTDMNAKVETIQIHKPVKAEFRGKEFSTSCIMQHTQLEIDKDTYDISNTHGIWQGASKEDTPERLEQSRSMVNVLSGFSKRKVLCGDFNLLPNTESIKTIENYMKNLIRENGITNTRSTYYKYPDRFADYIFVSPTLKIDRFSVLQDEISDHLPLLLDFT